MEDIVVSTNTDSVIAVSATTNTVSVVETEPVLISTDSGSVVTIGNEATVLVESQSNNLLITGLLGPQGVAGVSEDDMLYSKRVDFVSDTVLYKGEAAIGSLEGAPVWRIRRITIASDSDVTELWASGNANFDKAWSDRTTLIYS